MSTVRPFPGLRPFDFRDHEFFFGRKEQIYALYRLLDRHRFVAVVGGSGSGKSSLVRAGLLPLLEEETLEGGPRGWIWRILRPGGAPIEHLAREIAGLKEDEEDVADARREKIAFDLKRSSFSLVEALARLDALNGKSLLIVVDQFEELFRYARAGAAEDGALTRDEAAQFVQVLLEAARAPGCNVRVLITMRSDFIGDCARFHGLSEAVSNAQFLVPALTRDQLEEAIRQPVARVNGGIDSILVERLINDSSGEEDRLPALQHCLSRLWDLANEASDGSRRLTLSDYVDIGGIAGALSQHAEKIFPVEANLRLATEQAFRALSEIDKDGRAIRRALSFDKLLAETGVPEKDLREILDLFRAEECSFITPSDCDAPVFDGATTIDVGHEALLRHWRRVSGVAQPESLVPEGSEDAAARIGWLKAERHDGDLYRGLLSLLDRKDGGSATLPHNLVDERWSWWGERPRTPAWAERYGGDYERVVALLDASRAELEAFELRARADNDMRARLTKYKKAAVTGLVLSLFAITALFYGLYEQAKQSALQARDNEERFSKVLEKDAKLALLVAEEEAGGHVPVDSARRLLEKLDENSTQLIQQAEAPKADPMAARLSIFNGAQDDVNSRSKALGVKIKLIYGDAWYRLGDYDRMFDIIWAADNAARQLVELVPNDADWLLLSYETSFRIADALIARNKTDEAIFEYGRSLEIARSIAEKNPSKGLPLEVFVEGKIGESLQKKDKNNPEALRHLEDARDLARKLATGKPEMDIDAQSRLAIAWTKIGNFYVVETPPDTQAAKEPIETAVAILKALVQAHPEKDAILSNYATALGLRANALSHEDHHAAILAYEEALAVRRSLVEKDPSNVIGVSYLARDLERLADEYKETDDSEDALIAYRASLDQRHRLNALQPAYAPWKSNLDKTQKKLDDYLALLATHVRSVDGASGVPSSHPPLGSK